MTVIHTINEGHEVIRLARDSAGRYWVSLSKGGKQVKRRKVDLDSSSTIQGIIKTHGVQGLDDLMRASIAI